MRLDVAEVRDLLSVEQVIREYGLNAKKRGSQFRLTVCPRCSEKSSREAIAIDSQTGRWLHHGHERIAGGQCSGDIIDLIAALEGRDIKRDFRSVLERAAQIAGVTTLTDVELDLRRRQQQEKARQLKIAEVDLLERQRSTASSEWERLQRRSERGEGYLQGRALDAQSLVDLDAVRFTQFGPAVAIRDVDGCPMSTATRRYDSRPKVMALSGHSTEGTMIDCLQDITSGRDVVVTEGVIDSLTARLAWPDATILGANGSGNVPKVVERAIIRVKLAKTRLFIVPHDDEPGIRATTHAGRIAIAAGLDLDEQLVIVGLRAKDLNDAWSQGWRP